MYYRVAIQVAPSPTWQWRSSVLGSLQTLFQFLQIYHAYPQDRLRLFSSASYEDLSEQLRRENAGGESTSVTAAQFLRPGRRCVSARTGESAVRTVYGEQVRSVLTVTRTSSSYQHSSEAISQDARGMSPSERRRHELEDGPGGDHDSPYLFTLPARMPELRVWASLLARVRRGELEP